MDAFDLYLFNELTKAYAPNVLTRDEQESVYVRMRNLDYLEEVQPYLYAMRYFGWGTQAEPEAVLSELKDCTPQEQPLLWGLYHDLILSSGKGTPQDKTAVEEARKKGYSHVYLKNKSLLAPAEKKAPAKDIKSPVKDTKPPVKDTKSPVKDAKPPVSTRGKLNVTKVALFNSSRNGARKEDLLRYETAFRASTLDALYVKTMFQAPGKQMKLKYRIKVENLSNNTLFHESTGDANIGPQDVAFWIGVYANSGKWATGRYRYTWEIGGSQSQLLFTVS